MSFLLGEQEFKYCVNYMLLRALFLCIRSGDDFVVSY
jgi:hypothetical protein